MPSRFPRAPLLAVAATQIACGGAPVVTTSAPDPQRVAAVSGMQASAITETEVRRLLTALADDSLEGRGTGTRGSAKAARLIANEMRLAGLEPAGDSGFFQRVPVGLIRQGDGTQVPALFPSFAARDSMPKDKRLLAVNVVGRLRGTDPVLRDSVVLVDANYDHVGIGAAIAGDSIYNGADDNASGTVAVLEIARAMTQGPRPKRTVLFAAMTGEKVGRLGMRW